MKAKKIGKVWVDSGTVMVCDPCYLESNGRSSMVNVDDDIFAKLADTSTIQVGGERSGLAVAVRSGHGDGHYPVYAMMEKSLVLGLFVDFGMEGMTITPVPPKLP
jgi:hypothetical protein